MQAIILIDYENVQPKNLTLLRGRQVMTKIFIGAHQTRIPVDLVAELQPLGPKAEYIRIDGAGKDALDFHIAYYIGRLSAESPRATFHIVSKDTGFDPLIRHLATRNITCHRVAALSEIPGLESPSPGLTTERIQKVADNLLHNKQARPRKRKTLTAFIESQLGEQATDGATSQVMAILTAAGVEVTEDKVSFPLQ